MSQLENGIFHRRIGERTSCCPRCERPAQDYELCAACIDAEIADADYDERVLRAAEGDVRTAEAIGKVTR